MRTKVTRKTWHKPAVITVRDRTEKYQFSIHNRLVDEWIPVIGTTGFTLYALYVRMANRKDERAYPGFKSISKHFGFSHGTIAYYNQLLTWCKLIHIERYKLPDGRRYRNDYLILPIPQVTPDALLCLRLLVIAASEEESTLQKPNKRWANFLNLIIDRIANWQSLPDIWAQNRPDKSLKVMKAQMEMELPFAGDSLGDNSGNDVSSGHNPSVLRTQPQCPQDTTPVSSGHNPSVLRTPEQSEQTIRTNNPNKQSDNNTATAVSENLSCLLEQQGVDPDTITRLLDRYDLALIQHQLDWFPRRLQEYHLAGRQVRNPAGLLIKSIEGDWSEPAEIESTQEKHYGCSTCSEPFWSENPRCPNCGLGACCCEC